MTPTKTLLIAGAAAAVLTLGVTTYAAMPAPTGASAGVTERPAGQFHRAHWSRRHGMHGKGGGRFCSERHGRRFDRVTAVIEGLMTFTPTQDQAWKSLTRAVQGARETMKKECDALKDAERPSTASQKLARMETMLSSRLSLIQRIRPAFEEFYATLDEKQKSAIDNLFSRRGRK